MATALIFNLVSSLLVWHPEGQIFNVTPMTVTEWICDIVGIIWFFIGFLMMFYDTHQNEKEKIKEAALRSGMTGRAFLYYLHYKSIHIAIRSNAYNVLYVAACFALAPKLLP